MLGIRLLFILWMIRIIILLALASATIAVVHRAFHYVRGRRNRDVSEPA